MDPNFKFELSKTDLTKFLVLDKNTAHFLPMHEWFFLNDLINIGYMEQREGRTKTDQEGKIWFFCSIKRLQNSLSLWKLRKTQSKYFRSLKAKGLVETKQSKTTPSKRLVRINFPKLEKEIKKAKKLRAKRKVK